MTENAIRAALGPIANRYPADMSAHQLIDAPRIAFHVGMLSKLVPRGGKIADIGGGLGMFTPGCAAAGYQAILVDDFGDRNSQPLVDAVIGSVHAPLGVVVHRLDVMNQPLPFEQNSLDCITSFDCLEHLHNSPKRLLHDMMGALRPGGYLFLGLPNCANLRKRFATMLGKNAWSPMLEWYEQDTFRAHVREPNISDLRYIGRDLQLLDQRVFGRNWLGHGSRSAIIRMATAIADFPLRLRPSMCADIYLVGQKAT